MKPCNELRRYGGPKYMCAWLYPKTAIPKIASLETVILKVEFPKQLSEKHLLPKQLDCKLKIPITKAQNSKIPKTAKT